MNEKQGLHETIPRFSNLFLQCIALATALMPIIFSKSNLTLRAVLFFVIWWSWLVAAQVMPIIPEFSLEKSWIRKLWNSGGAMRAASCIVAAIYFPIFISKPVYLWIAALVAAIYYTVIFTEK